MLLSPVVLCILSWCCWFASINMGYWCLTIDFLVMLKFGILVWFTSFEGVVDGFVLFGLSWLCCVCLECVYYVV